MMNKENLDETYYNFCKRLLETTNDPFVITFTKKDGSERIMTCTRNPEIISKYEEFSENDEKKSIKENFQVMRVYDLENKGWRSFYLDSITKVEM